MSETPRSDGSDEMVETPIVASEGSRAEDVVEPEVVDAVDHIGEAEEGVVVELEPQQDPELVSLRSDLEAAQARLRAVSKAYTDLKDEMASFRTRVEAQSKFKEQRRSFDLVKAIFEPVQNLGRSVDAGASDPEGMLQGLKMVHGQFTAALEKLGFGKVSGIGARFDPNLHEALAVMPVTDASQDGLILQVYVDGYHVAGKVLQAAQVVVGKHDPPPPVAPPEPEVVDAEPEVVDAEEVTGEPVDDA